MTEDPRYSSPQQPGQRMPNQQGAPGHSPAGYSQPYDWRYGSTQPPYGSTPGPFPGPLPGSTPGMPPAAPVRKRFRPIALTVGALAIAAVSAGVGGMVAMSAQPKGNPVTTIDTAVPNGRNVPTANVPIGSVEQVAAKVVPSVCLLYTSPSPRD